MLTSYANNATKQTIISLAAAKGFAETLLEADSYRNKENADMYLEIARENLQLAINAVCEGLDYDQLQGIIKYAKNSKIAVVPSTNPKADSIDYVVSRDDLEILLEHATGECFCCDLEGQEIKNCPIRKALLHSQVIPIGEKDCPFKA